MEELQARILEARQSLRAGPSTTDDQRRNLRALLSEGLPGAVERLQRTPMSISVARRVADLFILIQDFIYTCLRSPLLSEGPTRMDLSPLLYSLRVLLSVEPEPPKYHKYTTPAGDPIVHFNRDHGKPLVRTFQGHNRHFWPDEASALR